MTDTQRPRQPEQPPRRFFTGAAKAWLSIIGALASFDGYLWIWTPGVSLAPSYEMATNFAPPWLWGWVMASTGLMAWVALRFDGHPWAIEMGRLSLTVYAVVSFVVGLSVFGVALVVPNTEFAVTISTKWWAISAACFMVLAGPTITTTRRVSLWAWFRS